MVLFSCCFLIPVQLLVNCLNILGKCDVASLFWGGLLFVVFGTFNFFLIFHDFHPFEIFYCFVFETEHCSVRLGESPRNGKWQDKLELKLTDARQTDCRQQIFHRKSAMLAIGTYQ